MSPTHVLPREAYEARRLADPAVTMRIVTRGDPRVLPEDPREVIKGAVPLGGRIAIWVALVLVAAAFFVGMRFVGGEGIDEYGAWWGVFWMLFPVPFVVPLLVMVLYGMRRSRRAFAAMAAYVRIRETATPFVGDVREVVVATSEGDVSYLVVRAGAGTREVIAYGRADILQTEVPPVGSRAYMWADAAGEVRVMQIAAGLFGQPWAPGAPL